MEGAIFMAQSRYSIVDRPRLFPAECMVSKSTSEEGGPYLDLGMEYMGNRIYLSMQVIDEMHRVIHAEDAVEEVIEAPVENLDTIKENLRNALDSFILGYFDDGSDSGSDPISDSIEGTETPTGSSILQELGGLRSTPTVAGTKPKSK